MIVNYASSIINKLEALLTDAARVVIYDRHVFIVQATEVPMESRYACLLGVGPSGLFGVGEEVKLYALM
jgi:hypothetical protein